ncbi:MAG: hypothetical protein NT115_08410, partial [Proteobacteria bacterium]|nr:hypothetical protein [Pseudomonadota bacterium]
LTGALTAGTGWKAKPGGRLRAIFLRKVVSVRRPGVRFRSGRRSFIAPGDNAKLRLSLKWRGSHDES